MLTWAILAACTAGLMLAIWVVNQRTRALPIHSLAVLPLENLSGDPRKEFFAEGSTDEFITMLAKESTLRITSRTSTMQYKGAHLPLRQIAQELGVDGIVEGTITRTGDQVHMSLQLIQASNDAHVWAESYDRDLKDAASLPREAAHTVAQKLNSVKPNLAVARYVSPEAHDAYLHGLYHGFLVYVQSDIVDNIHGVLLVEISEPAALNSRSQHRNLEENPSSFPRQLHRHLYIQTDEITPRFG